MSILYRPYFRDEAAAYKKVESIVWPNGPVCPHCGNADAERMYELKGQSHRMGLRKCAECRKQFTVKIGTIFERSHVPLHKWLQAIHLIASSKRGVSANQLHRVLEVTVKTAWFMGRRIRQAMQSGDLTPMGGNGGVVQAEEPLTGHGYTVTKRHDKKGHGCAERFKILHPVECRGRARSTVVDDLKARTPVPILKGNIDREARITAAKAAQYTCPSREFVEHRVVHHGGGEIHSNTVARYFSIFRCGMQGAYQRCAKGHLQCYVAEFDFRCSGRKVNNGERADVPLASIVGRRLAYRDSSSMLM